MRFTLSLCAASLLLGGTLNGGGIWILCGSSAKLLYSRNFKGNQIQSRVIGSETRITYLVQRFIVAKKFWVLIGDVFAYITSAFEHLSAS